MDDQNRKKLPKEIKAEITEKYLDLEQSKHFEEVKKIILKDFNNNPGELNNLWLPTIRRNALKWFNTFLEKRFKNFGAYEDVIDPDLDLIFHS